ncbi:MAG: serpin family protein [Deltaproteobacteria bacterium]|nr:serpin family protein [Deltaproteobacteria bacterium]
MRGKRWILLGLLILVGCECGPTGATTQPAAPIVREEAPAEETPGNESADESAAEPGGIVGSTAAGAPAPSPEQLASFARASNAFGFDLYEKTREATPEGNLAISPASIALAFDMAFGGARGETAAEMRQVMHIEGSDAALHEAASRILGRFNDPNRQEYELRVVNRLFGEETYTFEQDFLALTRTQYRAPLETIDFQGAPEAARQHINRWVGEQTAERITDLLPPESIQGDARLVLVNAIYFLGTWATPFEERATADVPFSLPDGNRVDVPTMHQVETMAYAKVDGVTVVELPYEGGELVMTLVVPDAVGGLPALEGRLDAETFGTWVTAAGAPAPGQLGAPTVSLFLPRFEMRTKVTLSDHLKALGMRQAFLDGVADFTGIANPPNPVERLHISEAYHQVFVAVDEEGTEAAAATAVVMGRGAGPPPAPPVEVRVDRPFLFAIRERTSGTVLFLGRINDPR